MAITRSVTGVDLGRDAIKAVQVELSGAEASIINSVSIPVSYTHLTLPPIDSV